MGIVRRNMMNRFDPLVTRNVRGAAFFVCIVTFMVSMRLLSIDPENQKSGTAAFPHPNEMKATNSSSITVDDIEWVSLKGVGTVSMGFLVRIPKLNNDFQYVAKIAGDKQLHYSTTEIEMMKILNHPPTIPSIPTLLLAVESIPNPFATWDIDRLTDDLGCSPHRARWLKRRHNISIQVQPLLQHTRIPKADNLPELARFMRSLLQALQFAHSRNVMNCDLHKGNLFYDNSTGIVYLFDWNAAFLYKPNAVYIHYDDEPKFLMPPEAQGNANATHATVSAFDVWSCGRMLSKRLCGHSSCPAALDKSSSSSSMLRQAYDLAALMKTDDPYQRPDTAALLRHPFLQLDTHTLQ